VAVHPANTGDKTMYSHRIPSNQLAATWSPGAMHQDWNCQIFLLTFRYEKKLRHMQHAIEFENYIQT
jgi:hypothetical protein